MKCTPPKAGAGGNKYATYMSKKSNPLMLGSSLELITILKRESKARQVKIVCKTFHHGTRLLK